MDFNTSDSLQLVFPPNNSLNDLQCIDILLLNDRLLEDPEIFIFHIISTDPAVIINTTNDLIVITILTYQMMKVCLMLTRFIASFLLSLQLWVYHSPVLTTALMRMIHQSKYVLKLFLDQLARLLLAYLLQLLMDQLLVGTI